MTRLKFLGAAAVLSALIATHNYELTRKMDRTLLLDKGTLVEQNSR